MRRRGARWPALLSQHNWFNQLLAVTGPSGTTSFGYDGNGNQVSKTDALGPTTYAYNYDNRLVGISAPSGSSYFEYDANGLRTKKSDSTGTRSYLLDGLSVVAEYAPDASRLAWYTQSLARIDEVLSVVNSHGKYWYEADALGSTYAMTNGAGAVVSRSAYDVFGERSLAAGTEVRQPFGFTGREHDQGGLVYARARYLAPGTGRWDRPDPFSVAGVPFVPGMPMPASLPWNYIGASAYEYPQPTVLTDPSGLWAAGIGAGGEFHLLTIGVQFWAYFVWDGRGGTGMLFSPAWRVGMALSLGFNPGFFVNPQANSIHDLRGWGGEAGLEFVIVTVSAQASIDKPNGEPIQDVYVGGGGSGFGAGGGIGAYLALGYSFLWEWTHPAGPTPCQ